VTFVSTIRHCDDRARENAARGIGDHPDEIGTCQPRLAEAGSRSHQPERADHEDTSAFSLTAPFAA
jgi:hypothetical protein